MLELRPGHAAKNLDVAVTEFSQGCVGDNLARKSQGYGCRMQHPQGLEEHGHTFPQPHRAHKKESKWRVGWATLARRPQSRRCDSVWNDRYRRGGWCDFRKPRST